MDAPQPRPRRRKTEVRDSPVHGKGVFAIQPIAAGELLLEYRGELITSREADRRMPQDPEDPSHTFFFSVSERHVIDANVGGNAARYVNHSCEGNCETEVLGRRVFIRAVKDIRPGEELAYDYHLQMDGRHTAAMKRRFACRCGAPKCRGTMLARKRG